MTTPSIPNSDWQRIWFSAQQREWRSLAIIPGHPGIDVEAVAEALATTGRMHGERHVSLVNAVGIELADVNELIDSVESMTTRGEWVIVPVDPIAENPTAMAIVRASSAALLVVRLGESQLAASQRVIDIVGRQQFLGCVVLDPVESRQPPASVQA